MAFLDAVSSISFEVVKVGAASMLFADLEIE